MQLLPEAAYWVDLFLFLPAILRVLQLNGLLEPIQLMFSKAMFSKAMNKVHDFLRGY